MREGAKEQGAINLACSEENIEGMCYFLVGLPQMNFQAVCWPVVFLRRECVLGH